MIYLSHLRRFKRGDVYAVEIPEADLSKPNSPAPPDDRLKGKHMVICLTDYDDPQVPPKHVVVAPISKAKSAVSQNKIYPTYYPMPKSEFPFLRTDSYAYLHQLQPINRHWLPLKPPIATIPEEKMKEITAVLFIATGSYKDVQNIIDETVKEKLREIMQSAELEASTTKDKDMEQSL